ncbi:hypothetical protein G3H63_15925 [Microbacterium resistens]|uniref:hypothetical protein n=1 Tax=Microbacterium resistens TaxID=156977 RepID=UPI00082E2569|nr:hypothetical protein [Microbacterium resistens]MBW1640551.1 hypothetical protein [Microbacterium resistens]
MPTTTAHPAYAARYVAAVGRSVPVAVRDEVVAELEAAIAEQVEPRIAAGEAPDAAERAVVAGLGEPLAYAASLTDRPLHVVGPRYYAAWLRLLKLLLWIVPPCVAVAVALATLLQGGGIGQVIGAIVPAILQSVVHIAFWTTLVFFVLERTGSVGKTVLDWDPDQLPSAEGTGAALTDLVATIVMCVLLAGSVLWDRFLGWGRDAVHVLSPDLWPGYGIGFLVIMALTILVAVLVFARGGWNVALAVVNALLGAVTAIAAFVLVWQGRFLAPGFSALFGSAQGTVMTILNVILTVVFVGVLFASAADGFRKLRASR